MKRHKILIVEDEQLLGKSITRYLSQKYECMLLENAEEAQRFLEAYPADLVVTDICLPGMSGVDLLHWICDRKEKLPVLLMTAHSSIRDAVDAMKQGSALTEAGHTQAVSRSRQDVERIPPRCIRSKHGVSRPDRL